MPNQLGAKCVQLLHELVLNLRTARRLGFAVPPAFLASVDEVIA